MAMKNRLTVLLIFLSFFAWSQKDIKPSDEFVVTGQVMHELKFTLADLEKIPSKNIGDFVVTNHLGEKRGTAKDLKGILLKDLLDKIELKTESPKVLSEFYLTFIATDNYKVVYSWNEIFNSPTGNNIFLITEKEGKKIADMSERILVITTSDFKTGRRHVKGLSKIVVARIDQFN